MAAAAAEAGPPRGRNLENMIKFVINHLQLSFPAAVAIFGPSRKGLEQPSFLPPDNNSAEAEPGGCFICDFNRNRARASSGLFAHHSQLKIKPLIQFWRLLISVGLSK